MDIVTDTSAILAVVLNEPSKKEIIEITKGAAFFAPITVYYEMGNALSALMKRGLLKYDEAKLAFKIFNAIKIEFQSIDMIKAIEIASKYSIYAYDAYILECAKRNRYPILTLDKRLNGIAAKMSIQCLEVK